MLAGYRTIPTMYSTLPVALAMLVRMQENREKGGGAGTVLVLSGSGAVEAAKKPEEERADRLAASLAAAGFRTERLSARKLADLDEALAARSISLVFSVALYLPDDLGRRRNVHAHFGARSVPFVGSPAAVLDLAIDKAALKRKWSSRGVLTPPFTVIDEVTPLPGPASLGLEFPLIVKPLREGNSRGIDAFSVANNYEELSAKTSALAERWGDVLVESFLGGSADFREFTVALVGDPVGGLVLPAEIRFEEKGVGGAVEPTSRIVTQAAKDGHLTSAIPLPRSDLRDRVASFAAEAFSVAGVRDYARCDIIQSWDRLYAIEINGQPMVPDSWFAACAEAEGLDEKGYLGAIVEASLRRLAAEGAAAKRTGGGSARGGRLAGLGPSIPLTAAPRGDPR